MRFKGIVCSVFSLILVFSACSLSASEESSLSQVCATRTIPINWDYCLTHTDNSKSRDVIYFFHGLGQDEHAWVDGHKDHKTVRKHLKELGVEAPVVVAISFGPIWLLTEKNSSSFSGYYEIFIHHIMPFVEKELLKYQPEKRFLAGESMGGFSVLQLLLKKPDLFDRAALVCPAIPSLSPFCEENEISKFIKRTHANPQYVDYLFQMGKVFFPDENTWEKASPLTLGKSLLGTKTPKIYMTANQEDNFGFHEGADLFFDLAYNKGVDVTYDVFPGKHCSKADPKAIALFFADR